MKNHFRGIKWRTGILSLALITSPLYADAAQGQLSIKKQSASLKQIIQLIEKESGYTFFFRSSDIDDSKKVNIDCEGSIEEVLKIALKESGMTYVIKDKEIILKPVPVTQNAQQKQITVTGVVVDAETKEAIIGANVYVKGTNVGVATDIDGNYSLTVTGTNPVIVASYLGYKTKEITYDNKRIINFELAPDSEVLEEVVVTAFGSGQKKASLVGSIQTVKPSELKVPSANLSTSFAGRLAGVVAVQRSGEPGADGANFWIRGISTISGATSPLIILDGVQVSSGDLNALDPEVIEGFSILKDATATALYGSRGANGVMVVTTKSGANLDKPIINFRMEASIAQPTKIPEFADGVTYMQLYNEAIGNLATGQAPYSQDKIDGTLNGLNKYVYPNVNWYDEIFKNTSVNENFNFNIRGGGSKVDYFTSISVNHETGMLKNRSKEFFSFDNNINLMRYAFQNNINAKLSKTSKLSLRLNAQMVDKRGPNFDDINSIFGGTISANPVDFPIFYEPDGITEHIKWGAYGGAANAYNPMASLVSGYRDTFQSTVIANLDYEQKLDFLTEGLTFKAMVSFKNWSNSNTYRIAPYNSYNLSSYEKKEDGTYDYSLIQNGSDQTVTLATTGGTSGDRRIYLQGMMEYNRTFGNHDVNGMFVYNQEETAVNNPTNLYTSLPNRKQGIAARLSYAYANKYMIEANFGYNGSENFAKGHRYGFFPSIALGYNISQEDYFSSLTDVISNLKIRGSYGLVGNDQIGSDRFVYLSDISLNGAGYTTGINQSYTQSGPTYNRYANNNLTWEVGKKLNVGMDLQLFNSLNINLDGFQEIRSDIFQQRGTIPNYLGTASTKVYGNLAKVKNWGFDASADYGRQINKDWTVTFKGTFTFARNKVLEYDEPSFMLYDNMSQIGQSLNKYLVYVSDGLFIDQEHINNSPTQLISGNVGAGDIKYVDQPNYLGEYDGQIDGNDKRWVGNPTVPEIVYGFGPSIKWKNFDFSLFFQGVTNTSLMVSGIHPFGTQNNRNVLKFIADNHWSPTNQDINATYPRLTKLDHANNTVTSTYWMRDGSFLKLKNAEVGYTYKGMRLYVTGSNLLTFSDFDLWDPEQGSGSGLKYPTQRVINIGFQMTIK